MSWELAKASATVALPGGLVGGVVGGVLGGAVGGITGVATDNKEFGKQVQEGAGFVCDMFQELHSL